MGRIVLYKSAADPLEAYGSAAERRKRGCTAVCGDRSGTSPRRDQWKREPASLITKPYRIVLFWSTMPRCLTAP